MIKSNEDRVVTALESIAESQIKQLKLAEGVIKRSQELFKANMAMMRESQMKIEPVKYVPIVKCGDGKTTQVKKSKPNYDGKMKLEGLDGTGKLRKLPKPDPNLIQYDLTK